MREDDPAAARAIPMIKHEALAQEAVLLDGAPKSAGVIVESESFGCCNGVYGRLRALAHAGAAPRLLVSERELRGNAREREVLEALVREGARVRVCDDSEKLAVAGDRVWLGSANATVAFGGSDCIDWGFKRPMRRSSTPSAIGSKRSGVARSRCSAASLYIPKSVVALESVVAATSASERFNSSASFAAVYVTYAGSFRLPRFGTGAR